MKILIAALVATFGAYAARVGLALSALERKAFLRVILGYGFLFLISAQASELILRHTQWIKEGLSGAVFVHAMVALGLFLWALLPVDEKKGAGFLLLPCPFCLLTVMFTELLFSQLLGKSVFFVALIGYKVFVALVLLFYFVGKGFGIRPREIMLGCGIFYLVLLLSARYAEEARRVLSITAKSSIVFPYSSLWLFAFLIVVFLAGFVSSGRRR